MASLVARALLQLLYSSALGAIFQLIFAWLCSATKKILDLESNLRSLKATLESINRDFPDTEAALFLRRRQLIEEGDELGGVKWWNVFKRWHYSMKANKLQASLDRLAQNDHVVVNIAGMREALKDLKEKVNGIDATVKHMPITIKQQIVSNSVRVLSDTVVVGCECEAKQHQDQKNFTECVPSGSGQR